MGMDEFNWLDSFSNLGSSTSGLDSVGSWLSGGSSTPDFLSMVDSGNSGSGSWWGGLTDSLGSLGNEIKDSWVGRNWDTISRGIDFGRRAYNLLDMNNARQGSRSDLFNALSGMAAQDQAYQIALSQFNDQRQAAANAAARANDAARRQAANEALKVQKKYFKQLQKTYRPYAKAAKFLTPQMSQNYKGFLDSTALLNQYLTPTVMNQLNQPVAPAFNTQIPQSAFSAPRVVGAQASFPSIEDMSKRQK
jgi:hypothetical protein